MPIITCNINRIFPLDKSTSLSYILWVKVVYNVEKSYVDRLDGRKHITFKN